MHRDRPLDAGITNALGYTLADHKRELPRAEQLIREALSAQPDNPALLDSLGWVLYRRGQFAARSRLERAFRLCTTVTSARIGARPCGPPARSRGARGVAACARRRPGQQIAVTTVHR